MPGTIKTSEFPDPRDKFENSSRLLDFRRFRGLDFKEKKIMGHGFKEGRSRIMEFNAYATFKHFIGSQIRESVFMYHHSDGFYELWF